MQIVIGGICCVLGDVFGPPILGPLVGFPAGYVVGLMFTVWLHRATLRMADLIVGLDPSGRRRGAEAVLAPTTTALHPKIPESVGRHLRAGDREPAVLFALRSVEIRVRQLAKQVDTKLGTALMAEAFSPDKNGPLTDPSLPPGESVGMMELFKGAIAVFKNPVSHRNVTHDAVIADRIVALADLLHRLLDRTEARLARNPQDVSGRVRCPPSSV